MKMNAYAKIIPTYKLIQIIDYLTIKERNCTPTTNQNATFCELKIKIILKLLQMCFQGCIIGCMNIASLSQGAL